MIPAIPNIYCAPGENTGPLFAAAFSRGCGGKIVKHYTKGPWAGFGSPQTWDTLTRVRMKHDDWYYGDHAYFGRSVFYRVTKNAFQQSGEIFPDQLEYGMERLKAFYDGPKPWNKSGRKIIICPQTDNFFERMGHKPGEWLSMVMTKLSLNTDREIIVHGKRDKKPLAAFLPDAWCVISHSSNAAVEALMAGVPVISTGDCPAKRMGLTDPINVEWPVYPDGRMEFAAMLAANQWTLDEIAAGECWKRIAK